MGNNILYFLIQIVIMSSLLIVILFMIRYNLSIKNERRISRYSIDPIKEDTNSIYDKISNYYFNIVKKMRPFARKHFNRSSKKYEKYVGMNINIEAIDFIIHKLIISIIFVLLATFTITIQGRLISIWELVVYLLIGYYILDIVLIRKNKFRIKQIENQMLRSIIIMNNAFKSGKSTIQAVKLASEELPEPISLEYKKMYKEMLYGLSVDVVFERFAKRIDIEEARYVSSSLIILNKTGGNIIKVFSSIERTLYDKKKLKEEQKNLTASSNMIIKVLLVIPIIFVAIIYLLNPDYFSILFDSVLGYLILGLMITMFGFYVVFLQRIMKVRV